MAEGKIIGIDLGTTFSCVAVWVNGVVEVIPNDQGNRITPSMVAFTPKERLVGDAARHQIANNAKNTLFDVKRLIGRRYTDEKVQRDIEMWPFKVTQGDNDQPLLEVEHRGRVRMFVAEEVSSMILSKMKSTAEEYLDAPVTKAVITVPAYFNDSQRRATKDAATIAGLDAVRIINEPSAAAVAYGFNPDVYMSAQKKSILVFDLGGGTFDVSILTVKRDEFTVKGVGGDMHLGGEDFDNTLVNYCVETFQRKNRDVEPPIRSSPKALRRLKAECERSKRNLSIAVETDIDIDSLYQGIDFRMKLTRAKFEELNMDMFEQCIKIVHECILNVGMRKGQIDEIILIGGSTRIPKVQEMLRQFFNGKPLCKSMNPDEAVAMGAAIQGAALAHEDLDFVLQDVTPLSLGLEVNNGAMQVLIPRNSPVPCDGEKVVSTLYDNQTAAAFRIFEGERPMVSDNHMLGELILTGIPPAKCGVPRMRVLFEIDEDGILNVSAQEKVTGISSHISIKNDGGRLDARQVEKMLADAERFQQQDEEAQISHLARNELQCFIHNMMNRVAERRSSRSIDASLAQHLEGVLINAEDWMDEQDYSGEADTRLYKQKLKELKGVCRPLINDGNSF